MAKHDTQQDCSEKVDDRNLQTVVSNWWLLPAHLICSILLVIILLAKVDGRLFRVGTSYATAPPSVVSLSQNDVTTLISIAVVIVRTLAGTWLTLLGWRLAFILLERRGVTLEGFSRIIRYRLPPVRSPSDSISLVIIFWAVFLLSVPVQIASPILTGAVSWIPTLCMAVPEEVNVTRPGFSENWQHYGEWPNTRYYMIVQAFGVATLSPNANFSSSAQPTSRRYMPTLRQYPSNSTLHEVMLPYLNVESVQWVQSEAEISANLPLFSSLTSDSQFNISTISSITTPNPCFHGTDPGKICPVFNKSWEYDATTYPAPKLIQETRYVIVSVNGVNGPCDQENDFGSLPGLYHYESWSGSVQYKTDVAIQCFVFARVTYSAGVVKCQDCPLNAVGMVETLAQDKTIEADSLTEQALRHMPDVLPYMQASNLWSAWRTKDNLEGYTRGMLQLAYQSSWNSLADGFKTKEGSRTMLSRPYSALTASVSRWRAFVWLALNALLTASGVMLGVLQRPTHAKTVNNGELELLLLDTSQVVEKGTSGLCNKVDAKSNKGMQLRLRFRGGQPHAHPFLEMQNNDFRQLPQTVPRD